jgi:hypothetical protein
MAGKIALERIAVTIHEQHNILLDREPCLID